MKSPKILLAFVMILISFATSAQEKAGKKDTAKHQAFYSCPMHDTVSEKKPGKCPICGMKLQMSSKEQMKSDVTKNYSCPQHLNEVSTKPGKCSKCGTEMALTGKEKMRADMDGYHCPMKCNDDKSYDKSGKCPKCGMALVEKKKDDKSHDH